MRRDIEFIRDILLGIEQDHGDPDVEIELTISGRSAKEISYHVRLLSEARFVHAHDLSVLGPDGFRWLPLSLTFRGHEFLDTIREKEIWRQTS